MDAVWVYLSYNDIAQTDLLHLNRVYRIIMIGFPMIKIYASCMLYVHYVCGTLWYIAYRDEVLLFNGSTLHTVFVKERQLASSASGNCNTDQKRRHFSFSHSTCAVRVRACVCVCATELRWLSLQSRGPPVPCVVREEHQRQHFGLVAGSASMAVVPSACLDTFEEKAPGCLFSSPVMFSLFWDAHRPSLAPRSSLAILEQRAYMNLDLFLSNFPVAALRVIFPSLFFSSFLIV